jgi:hypothetical protein
MRSGGVPLAVLTGLAFSLSPFACVDLFHSTDFETLCDIDARAGGCSAAEASTSDVVDASDAATNFCSWSSQTARARAEHACAWLGACSAPFDQNAFGQCMINAILAYDCTANPGLTIAPGALHEFWDKLWQARSCTDVPDLNPQNVTCGTGYACPSPGSSTLLECVEGSTHAETCMVLGKVCGGVSCEAPEVKKECDPPSCDGTVLHACEDSGIDEGYDCRYFGAAKCFADESVGGCTPGVGSGEGQSCVPVPSVSCDGGVAVACIAGAPTTINCALLTGPGTCVAGAPSWDVSGACQADGGCSAACVGGDRLTGCAQGATFSTSCKAQGLGGCHSVRLPQATGYACSSP